MINVIIVEDDDNSALSLQLMLGNEYRILGVCKKMASAIETINRQKPDLVFLDIELPDGKGYDLPKETAFKDYKIIFTTTYSEYAIKGFELAALHYLLKPFDENNLREALDRYNRAVKEDMLDTKLNLFRESIVETPQKIILYVNNQHVLYNIADILYCNSESNYCHVHFTNGQNVIISRTLGAIAEVLTDSYFSRISQSYLINMRYVRSYQPGRNPNVTLTTGLQLNISETYRSNFKETLETVARAIRNNN